MSDVTRVLRAIDQGDPRAADELLPLVYRELRQLASRKLAREAPGQTIQATDLVHEAYLRLVGSARDRDWDGRGHFFAAAAEAMRRILIERARRRRSLKRGGGMVRQELTESAVLSLEPHDDVLAIDEALHDPVQLAGDQLGQLLRLQLALGGEPLRSS